jgi:hypothetical protein
MTPKEVSDNYDTAIIEAALNILEVQNERNEENSIQGQSAN